MSAGPRGYVARAMRSLVRHTARFVCISDYVAGLVRSYGIPPEKVTRIHCAIETGVAREHPSTLREELRLADDAVVVGSTGIWRPNKGFPIFIAACERVQSRRPGTRFLLGGRAYAPDAGFATSIWVRGQFLRASGTLHFTGFQKDVNRFLSALDVFVLPSECEPFGLILVEAMARGVPVVATAAGGVPEIVIHNRTGLLVPPNDPRAMGDALIRLAGDAVLRDRLGAAGREHVRRHYSLGRMIRDYEALWEQTLASRGEARRG